jgi:hypothetical protein
MNAYDNSFFAYLYHRFYNEMKSLITTLFEVIFLVKYRPEFLNICIVIIYQCIGS